MLIHAVEAELPVEARVGYGDPFGVVVGDAFADLDVPAAGGFVESVEVFFLDDPVHPFVPLMEAGCQHVAVVEVGAVQ